MNVEEAIDAYARGETSWDALTAQFQAATFTVRKPTEGDWGAVYARAEEPFDPTEVPANVYAAKTARQITADQAEELLAIFRAKVTGGS